MQAKNASDTAFVCSYGQGLSPALQPTRVSGHSLILPRARPPGSSHSRLCPLPILFQPGRGCGSWAKMLPASCQGCSLFSCCFLQGCTAPSFLPAGCVVLEVCQPQTVTQQNPAPLNKAAPSAIPQFPHPWVPSPQPWVLREGFVALAGGRCPRKKIHFKPIYITVSWCFTLLYTPKSGLWEQIPRALYGEGPNTTSKGTRSAVGMVSSFRQNEVTSG